MRTFWQCFEWNITKYEYRNEYADTRLVKIKILFLRWGRDMRWNVCINDNETENSNENEPTQLTNFRIHAEHCEQPVNQFYTAHGYCQTIKNVEWWLLLLLAEWLWYIKKCHADFVMAYMATVSDTSIEIII